MALGKHTVGCTSRLLYLAEVLLGSILAELLPENEDFVKAKKEKLLDKGFKFDYHTHTYLTQKQQTYIFCYEYGYLPLEQDMFLIVKRKEE